jgi:predicted DCC family thiol-disulfide oxidoreductase YuxK
MKDFLLVDGWCNLCHWLSKFVRKRLHRGGDLDIFAIESEEGQAIIQHFSPRHQRADSVYLVRKGKTYIRSSAAIRVLLYLKWYYKMWYPIAWFIPLPLRDGVYILVSKSRKAVFGTRTN